MKIRAIVSAVVASAFLAGSMSFATDSLAAISASATYGMSTSDPSTPDQAVRWQITATSNMTVASVAFSTQSSMIRGVASSALHVVTTLPGGSIAVTPGGLRYVLARPTTVRAGTRIWMTVGGLTSPASGNYYSVISLLGTRGNILEHSTAYMGTAAANPCRTTAWPSDYIQAENQLPGTPGWQIDPSNPAQISNRIAAYAENPSVKCGDTLNLRVNDLDSPALYLTAYRLGYYGGVGAREVWQTNQGPWLLGAPQPSAMFVSRDSSGNLINMVTAKNWSRSFSVQIDGNWTPGAYLIAIRTSSGQGRYVPIVVRDDLGVHAQKVVLNSAEWQAYNLYGDYDAYNKAAPYSSKRISFDRPYLGGAGSGNLLLFEYGYIFWGEKQNLDLTYIMDTDAFGDLSQFDNQHMITLIGHPEYWTTAAFNKLVAVRAAGTNLLSLTANALYWRIEMASSDLTGPNREYVITKQPGSSTDTFREGGQPEQTLLGSMYGCANAYGDATADSSWLWNGVAPGTVVPQMVKYEADGQIPGWPTAQGASIVTTIALTHSLCSWSTAQYTGVADDAPGCPTACEWNAQMKAADIMEISGVPGGRVFHGASINWVTTLLTSPAAGQATLNAIAFLNNGLAPATSTSASPASPTSHASTMRPGKLVRPLSQKVGVLSPGIPSYPIPTE